MSFAGVNPYAKKPAMPPIPIKVRWDYTAETVVDDGVPTLFDTTWTYIFYGPDEPLMWGITKHPGHHQFLAEASVPELIKLAVLVT